MSEYVRDRTEGQCYRRWTRQILKEPGTTLRVPWTSEEDQKLQEAVEYCNQASRKKASKRINWVEVSERMDGKRTPLQCSARWSRAFVPKETGRVINAPWQPSEVIDASSVITST